jgi:DHA1 family bicyclomycin/chloramphenicol resistance-like MFS transporter
MSQSETIAQPRAPLALLVTLMVTSQVAITIFLPSMPSIAEDLGTTQSLVQLTVSAYLGAFAVAQLVVGPISDAIGRRKPMLIGLVLFTLASLACAAATSIELLIAGRIIQAFGGCVCIAISRAIVRDTSDGAAATRAMAYLGMSLAVAPTLAPLLGGQLESFFGWQANFLFTAAMGATALLATYLTLAETLPPEARKFTTAPALARTYVRLFGMRKFMGYSLSVGAMGSTFQAFLAGSPFALIVLMGVSPQVFGYFVISGSAGYITGNFISSRMARRASRGRMIWLGGALAMTGTGIMVIQSLIGLDTPIPLILPLAIYSIGAGFLAPNCLAGALTAVEPAAAGSAAALGGFIQMGSGFISTLVVVTLIHTSFLQLALVMFACTTLSWLFFIVLVAPKEREPLL